MVQWQGGEGRGGAPDSLGTGGSPERPDLVRKRLDGRAQLADSPLERGHEGYAVDDDAGAGRRPALEVGGQAPFLVVGARQQQLTICRKKNADK